MKDPLVSISLVAFNQEPYIREAIESCLMQVMDFNYEIIIHDDASPDKTPQIIQEYANKYPEKINSIIQTENQFSQGIEIIARNVIPKARGKYIAFLEADDYWIDPKKLAYQIEFLESHQDVSMCFTATKKINASNPQDFTIRRYRHHDCICPPEDVILMGGHLLDMGSVVVRKSIFDDVPDWYYSSRMWDNTIPLLSTSHGQIQYLNKVTASYRVNIPGSYIQKNVRYMEKRKSHILTTLELLEGFNQGTDYKFDKLIKRKTRLISVGMLLLSSPDAEIFKKYYSQLTPGLKLEYQVFNTIGWYRLWERYRQILSHFRKIKYI